MRGLLRIALMVIAFMMLSTNVMAQSTNVSWDTPTTKCDGSALNNLVGYNLWWGETGRPTSNVMPGIPSTHTIPACDTSAFTQFLYDSTQAVGLVNAQTIDLGTSPLERTFYITVTAVSAEGESIYTNQLVKVVPPTLLPPSHPPNPAAD